MKLTKRDTDRWKIMDNHVSVWYAWYPVRVQISHGFSQKLVRLEYVERIEHVDFKKKIFWNTYHTIPLVEKFPNSIVDERVARAVRESDKSSPSPFPLKGTNTPSP